MLHNGHRRKQSLKYQSVTTPDGLILHAHGPMAGCRHDWALYLDSDIDEQLEAVWPMEREEYYVHLDTGYNCRHCLGVPFSRASLTAAQRAANLVTGGVQVTAEWMYKETRLY